jgi:predicted metal-dependent phosphoesterase TrpH
MAFADLHIHSIHSYDGTSSISAILKYVANNTDLKVIAITDHNTMAGIPEAMKLAPSYGIEVIPGCEISTADGHLLALFVKHLIPAGLSLKKTIQEVGYQGGICIAAHPMAKGINSLSFKTIQRVLEIPDVGKVFVGIEAYNSGLVYTQTNNQVEEISRSLPLAQVGNSDAHTIEAISLGSTEFDGNTAQELRFALETRTTKVRKKSSPVGFGVLVNYLPRYLLRKLGWVTYNVAPNSPLTYERLSKAIKPSTILQSQ